MVEEKVMGVTWNKRRNKWCAQIMVKGKNINLGSFINKNEAINARQKAEKEYHFPEKYRKLTKNIEGEKYGEFTIIGDTGKRTGIGHKIVIARGEDGEIVEAPAYQIKSGNICGKRKNSSTGEKHIYFDQGKYKVQFKRNGKTKGFGTFPTLLEATAKRDEVLQQLEQGLL